LQRRGSFIPQGNATRAEVVAMIERVVRYYEDSRYLLNKGRCPYQCGINLFSVLRMIGNFRKDTLPPRPHQVTVVSFLSTQGTLKR